MKIPPIITPKFANPKATGGAARLNATNLYQGALKISPSKESHAKIAEIAAQKGLKLLIGSDSNGAEQIYIKTQNPIEADRIKTEIEMVSKGTAVQTCSPAKADAGVFLKEIKEALPLIYFT